MFFMARECAKFALGTYMSSSVEAYYDEGFDFVIAQANST
jgi:hypothetical protein